MPYTMIITRTVDYELGYADPGAVQPKNELVANIVAPTFFSMMNEYRKWIFKHVPDIPEAERAGRIMRDTLCDTRYRIGDLSFCFHAPGMGI